MGATIATRDGQMQNRLQRELARSLISGREDTVMRLALASRFAAFFRSHPDAPRFPDRPSLYAYVSEQIFAGRPFDYLEFGVFQGASIREVARLNPHPDCRFTGFDSFEGLPEDWNPANPKGTFAVGGQAPQIDDARVAFVKGWFNETLPDFLAAHPPAERLWVHVDCDLYSSSLYVLSHLEGRIRPGVVLAFDEFEDLMAEFKAFCDFQAMTGRTFRLLGATTACRQVALLCTG